MNLKPYEFELLALLVIFLAAGLLRSLLILILRIEKLELNYFLSNEAASDLAREVAKIDEVSMMHAAQKLLKPKRQLYSLRYLLVIAMNVLLQIAIVFSVPLATLFFRDEQVIMPAVEYIDKNAYWSTKSRESELDVSQCLNPSKQWRMEEDVDEVRWTCEQDEYLLVMYDAPVNSSNDTPRASSLQFEEIKCKSCSYRVSLSSLGSVALRDGTAHALGGIDQMCFLKIDFYRYMDSPFSSVKACVSEPRIMERTTNDKTCASAVNATHLPGNIVREWSLSVYQDADFSHSRALDEGKKQKFLDLLYPADHSFLNSLIAMSDRGDTAGVLGRIFSRIAYKKLDSQSLEHKLHLSQGSQITVGRKSIDRTLVAVTLGVLVATWTIAKCAESICEGSESDRSRLRRVLATGASPTMSMASSFELRDVNDKIIWRILTNAKPAELSSEKIGSRVSQES